jgi:hypothetical protein
MFSDDPDIGSRQETSQEKDQSNPVSPCAQQALVLTRDDATPTAFRARPTRWIDDALPVTTKRAPLAASRNTSAPD